MCKKCQSPNVRIAARARRAHCNRTTFGPGWEPRRHRFTTDEQREGFRHAIERHEYSPVGGWIREKVRRSYCHLRRRILAAS